jgi:predicted nucleic acid-binding protein
VVIAVFDTNILIDYLNGEVKAKNIIEQYDQIAISVITYVEVMAGVKDVHKKDVECFLKSFQILNFDEKMTEDIVKVRNTLRVKLPDAIILATARENKAILVTRNSKYFSKNNQQDVVIPYKLEH